RRRFIDSLGTAVGAMTAEAYAIARRCALRVQSVPLTLPSPPVGPARPAGAGGTRAGAGDPAGPSAEVPLGSRHLPVGPASRAGPSAEVPLGSRHLPGGEGKG